jgi:hypothetical protein
MKNCLAIRASAMRDHGQMIAFVGSDLNIPNEAKRLLKNKVVIGKQEAPARRIGVAAEPMESRKTPVAPSSERSRQLA